MIYNIGDKVIVRDGLIGGEYYNHLYFNEIMETYIGNVFKITTRELNRFDNSNSFLYQLEGICGVEEWLFSEDMLTKDIMSCKFMKKK